MRPDRFLQFVTAAVLLTLACAGGLQAQITGIVSSDVEGFFGTQSDAYQADEPPLAPVWPASGLGPYGITGPVNVPPLFAGFPNPTLPVVPNISYTAPTGHSNMFAPDIQGTRADYFVKGGFGGSALFTRDAYVSLGPLGTTGGMHLGQPNSATGYAYEEIEFAMSYSVGSAGIQPGAVTGLRPFLVSGHVAAGGYAQFGADINYWWLATIPGSTVITSITNLGSLQYNYFVNSSPGPFSSIVTQTSLPLLGATGTGFLEITGNAFVAGDPMDIAVTDAPEPQSIVLVALGLGGLALFAGRRRERAAAENPLPSTGEGTG